MVFDEDEPRAEPVAEGRTPPPGAEVEDLADGVYIGLPEWSYFAQDRLGSSDLIRLDRDREGWWWQSRHNPDRVAVTSPYQNYGSALHAILLEGLPAYQRRFLVEPDWRAIPADELLTTIPQLKTALAAEGFEVSKGCSGYKLADWEDYAIRSLDPAVWTVKAGRERAYEAELKRTRATRISAVEDRQLRLMHSAIYDDPAPEAREVRDLLWHPDFPPVAELSVLWTDRRGVRRRARVDKPTPALSVDLKSLGNWQGRELHHATGDIIARNRLQVQRADYDDARGQARRMLTEEGLHLLHGGSDEERAYVGWMLTSDACATWDWVWLFYQKPDPKGRAPVVFPVWDDGPRGGNASELLADGRKRCARALALYQTCMARFGPDRPWTRIERLHFTGEGQEPRVIIPHWMASDEEPPTATDGEGQIGEVRRQLQERGR